MPAHRAYDVTSMEGGDSAPKSTPPSTGWWIIRLIGFFIFCIFVLIVCLLWLKPNHHEPADGLKKQETNPNDAERLYGTSNSSANTSRADYVEVTTESPTTLAKKTDHKLNTTLSTPGPTVTSTTQPTTTTVEKNPVISSTESPPVTTTTDKITETEPILLLGKIKSDNETTEPSTTLSSTVETIPPDPSLGTETFTEKIIASSTSSPDQEKISNTTGTLADGLINQETTEVSTSSTELKSTDEITTILAKNFNADETTEPSTSTLHQERSSGTTTLDDDSTTEGRTESSAPSSDTVQNTELEHADENSTLSDTEGSAELEINTNVTTESITSDEEEEIEPTPSPGGEIATIKTTVITETPSGVPTSSPDRESKSTNDMTERSTTDESTEPSTSTRDQERSSETTTTLEDDSTSVGSTESSTLSSDPVQNAELEPADENSILPDTEGSAELEISTNVTTESITSDKRETTESTTNPEEQITTIETTVITGTPSGVPTSSTDRESKSTDDTTEGPTTGESTESSTSTVDQEPSSETTTTLDDDSTSEGSTESSTPSSDPVQNKKLEPADENITPPDTEGTAELGIDTTVTSVSITSDKRETTEPTTQRIEIVSDTKIINKLSAAPSRIVEQKLECAEADAHSCSQIASRMLFYMNHSADACEDFYEYACGGFEGNQLISESDLAKQATQRIFDQAKKFESKIRDTEFLNYYQSCVNHHKKLTKAEKINLAKEAIGEVGRFYTAAEWKEEYFDLTATLSKLFLHNSAPFFEITPDVAVEVPESCEDEVKPPRFTLKLGLPLLESITYMHQRERVCGEELEAEMQKKRVDFRDLYIQHTACKNNLKDFLDFVEESLKNLSNLSDNDVYEARFAVEEDLMRAFYRNYTSFDGTKSPGLPTEEEILTNYVAKKYKPIKIGDLQNQLEDEFVNWKLLLENLRDSSTEFEEPLQVYFAEKIQQGLDGLYNSDRRTFNNALLGFYTHKIYNEFVASPPDVEDHCKRVAIDSMRTHASSLYMSSFSQEELADMHETVTSVFQELKSTLMSGVDDATWLEDTEKTRIRKKIERLTIEIPDISYYQGDGKLNIEYSEIEDVFTGNYFNDTIMLQKNYRKSMYRALEKSPIGYEQIWTQFGQPYQTAGSAIYGLNKIILPYGAIDWSVVRSAKKVSSHHLVLATLGTRIADLIAHHFDSTGIQYFAGKRNATNPPVFCGDDDAAAQTYESHVTSYKLFSDDLNYLVLPSTGQDVKYTMTELSLNERLSAATGLQLAYDTMSRLPRNSKKLLPWLDNQPTDVENQFFLAYAQMHCTKVPLTSWSSIVSLYEAEHLPSRFRIRAAASSTKVLGKTWNCRIGSGVLPSVVPSPFPHLEAGDDQQQISE